VRPNRVLDAAELPDLIDASRAYRATGLDLKKQTALSEAMVESLLERKPDWPTEPGWQAPIDGLRYLNIKGTSITDHAAATIAKMTPLQVLILNDHITDEGLKTIAAGLVNLVKFRPGGPAITNKGLAALRGLRHLHRLNLSDTSVTDEGLPQLSGLPLIEIDLPATVGDGALGPLSQIPTLVHLELAKTHITAQGIQSLTQFSKLHTLFVGRQLDDKGTEFLVQIPTLRRLDLTRSRVTDTGVKTLSALLDLQELALTGTGVTDQGLAALKSLRRLRFLEVSDTRVTIDGIGPLAGLPELDVVSLTHTGPLKLRDLKPLGKLPALKTVIINGNPLKHEAMDYIRRAYRPRPEVQALPWVHTAWAAETPPALSDDADVAALVTKSSAGVQADSGLQRIYDVQSELDDIVTDEPAAKKIALGQDYDPKSFLGEFTVQAATPRHHHD
jgi:hypothetical protein